MVPFCAKAETDKISTIMVKINFCIFVKIGGKCNEISAVFYIQVLLVIPHHLC
jgi:hypothetical protein